MRTEWFFHNFTPSQNEISGQIIATSHDRFPPRASGLEGKSPYFREIQGKVKYYSIWPEIWSPFFWSFDDLDRGSCPGFLAWM